MKVRELADVLEVAVRIERHSVELYMTLYDSVRSSRAKDAFAALAADEEKHLGLLRQMLVRTSDYEPRYRYPGEYELYVDGMASRALESFHEMGRSLSVKGSRDAIGIGIDLERGKIAFYSDARKQFKGADERVIADLAEEEKGHLARLRSLLKTYPEA